MEVQKAEPDGPSDGLLSNHVAAAAVPAAATAAADPQQDAAEALLHSQHTGDEDEIAEVDPQNRYYRYMLGSYQSPSSRACSSLAWERNCCVWDSMAI